MLRESLHSRCEKRGRTARKSTENGRECPALPLPLGQACGRLLHQPSARVPGFQIRARHFFTQVTKWLKWMTPGFCLVHSDDDDDNSIQPCRTFTRHQALFQVVFVCYFLLCGDLEGDTLSKPT